MEKYNNIYFVVSYILGFTSLYLINNNIIKYKVLNPTGEMKRDAFIKNVNNNEFNQYSECYPYSSSTTNNCYEIINGIKFRSYSQKQCTISDWNTVENKYCNVYSSYTIFIMFIVYIYYVVKLAVCKCHCIKFNDRHNYNISVSILSNISSIYDIIINILINYNGLENKYVIFLIINIPILCFLFPIIVFSINSFKNKLKNYINNDQKVFPIINNEFLSNINNVMVQPSDNNLCLICYDNNRNILFSPCNHLCCCEYCSNNLSSCPYCRQIIENKINVFIP